MGSRLVVSEYFRIENRGFLVDEESIKSELRLALEKSGATVFDVYGRKLGPGVTALAIIGDSRGEFRGRSHGAFHTYPEYAYARLTFDCYPHMNAETATGHFYGILQSDPPIMGEIKLALEEL